MHFRKGALTAKSLKCKEQMELFHRGARHLTKLNSSAVFRSISIFFVGPSYNSQSSPSFFSCNDETGRDVCY